MRLSITLALLCCISCLAFGQKNKNKSEETAPSATTTTTSPKGGGGGGIDNDKKVYQMSLRYGDYIAATQAVYNIIAVEGETSGWKDTLNLLYFTRENYVQSLLLSNELMTKRPDDKSLMEIKAVSLESIGNAKEALEAYEKLYPLSKNINHLYQIATLQFQLARLGECSQNLQQLAQDPAADKATVVLTFNQQRQRVPIHAAALNMQGILLANNNKRDESKTYFEQAVKAFPDFALAKANLEALAQGQTPKK